MYFLLKSEVETIDIQKNYYKKRVYCPSCFKTQVKKLDSNEFYIHYHCWNKNCEERNIPFVILNKYLHDEEAFGGYCDTCQELLHREFKIDENQNLKLVFKCNTKFCEANIEPYCYNFRNNNWDGKSPGFRLYDDMLEQNKSGLNITENPIKVKLTSKFENEDNDKSDSILEDSQETQKTRALEQIYKIEEIPLLTMNNDEYSKFLEHHQNKVVCLVDLPNFIRTLREFFPRDFENVLKKAHLLLLQYIENSFHTTDNYIIRYFSKPDKDLEIPNNIIINFCTQNQEKEFFQLLRVLKGKGYSDIDNYLIANSVEIIERCEVRGFIIVSSDKDYLPVMRIASYKKIKSRILGINTSEIYEQYNIDDIKFLGIMKFFEK